jgi:hypothetical protein
MKQRRLKERVRATGLRVKEQDRADNRLEAVTEADAEPQSHREETPEPVAGDSEVDGVPCSMTTVDLIDLTSAISSLRSKLEMVQPEGMRPSDIDKARAGESNLYHDNDMMDLRTDESGDTPMEESNDALLSQVPTSQQSILLWDDLRLLVEASASVSEREHALVSIGAFFFTIMLCSTKSDSFADVEYSSSRWTWRSQT